MDLFHSIVYLFPNAKVGVDFGLRDDSDGKGPYIEFWDIDVPQPTKQELQAAWEAYQAEESKKAPIKSLEEQLSESREVQARLSQELSVQKDINTANSQNFMDLIDYLTEKGVLE